MRNFAASFLNKFAFYFLQFAQNTFFLFFMKVLNVGNCPFNDFTVIGNKRNASDFATIVDIYVLFLFFYKLTPRFK